MAPNKPESKRSKVSFFPFSRKNAPEPTTPDPPPSSNNDAEQPAAPVKRGLFRRSSRASIKPTPPTPDIQPQTTDMPNRPSRGGSRGGQQQQQSQQQRGREQSRTRNASNARPSENRNTNNNNTPAVDGSRKADDADNKNGEAGRPSVSKKPENRNKSWFSWNASKKLPDLTDPAESAAAAAEAAAAAADPFSVLVGDAPDGPRITRDGNKGPHALSKIATARTNRQLSIAGNKSVRWSYEDLQARGPPPFEVGQNLDEASPRGQMQKECMEMLEKLIVSARYQREIQERNAVIEILKEQRDSVQTAIVETNDAIEVMMKEQEMLAVRMGHYYSQLAKERLRSRIVAVYEDYQRVAALKVDKQATERASLTSLNESLSQAGFGERIHNDMLAITRVLANNDLALETEMAKLDNDWQDHNDMNKELNGRTNILQRANLEINEKILGVKQNYSLQAKQADELKRREIEQERQRHDILRESLRVREAERERRYDSLMALLDRIISGAMHRHKLASKKTLEFHRQWDEELLRKVLANDKKFDDATIKQKYSSEFYSFFKFLQGLNLRLLNEKRIHLEFEVDRLQWQADTEMEKKRHFMRMRNVFIEHQHHRYLEEDDTDSVYLITPIELTIHESISQGGAENNGGELEFEIQTVEDEETGSGASGHGGKLKKEKRLRFVPRRKKKRPVDRDVDVQSTFA